MRLLTIVLVALTLGLSGCGKKGDLAPPPSHADPDRQDEEASHLPHGETLAQRT